MIEFWNTINNRQKVNVNILTEKNVKIAELVKLLNLIGIGERAGSGIPNIYVVWKNQG